jgi:hypothetical protein
MPWLVRYLWNLRAGRRGTVSLAAGQPIAAMLHSAKTLRNIG